MKRMTEAGLLAASAVVAGLGVALVDLGRTGEIGLTPVFFLIAYGCSLAGMWLAVHRWAPHASPFLLPPATMLAALGMVEIYRIDPGEGSFQVWWGVATVVAAIGVMLLFRWGVGRLMSAGYLLIVSGLILIVVPFLPRLFGVLPEEGAGLWLSVEWAESTFLLQPFGLGLLLLLLGLAAVHSRWVLDVPAPVGKFAWLVSTRHLLLMAAVWLVTLPVLWATGDLTAWMTVVLLSGCIAFVATAQARVIWVGLALVGGGSLLGLASFRVRETIGLWLDPFSAGEAGAGPAESLLALGSGHLSGSGLGMGDPDLIPYATSDGILAALGEELGLAGTVAVIALHGLLVAAGIGVALDSRELFCKVAAASLAVLFGLMFLAGAGGLLRLLPPTRMGLPFLSHGGLSLLTGWLAMGLLLRIGDEERGPL